MMRAFSTILGIGLMFLTLAPASCPGAEGPSQDFLIILDYSNSMWGKINNNNSIESKFEIMKRSARYVFSEIITKNIHNNIGVMAYGHRSKSCTDVEIIAKPLPITNDVHAASIDHFFDTKRPIGYTPITNALEFAANQGYGNIQLVLLTDGKEEPSECIRNPCDMAAALKRVNATLKVHIIGFSLAPGDREALKCVADNTGGQFIEVKTEEGLRNTLMNLLNEVPSLPAPAPLPQTRFEARIRGSGKPLLLAPGLTYSGIIIQLLPGEPPRPLTDKNLGAPDQTVALAPGNYLVRATYAGKAIEESFTVTSTAAPPVRLLFPPALSRLAANGKIDAPGNFAADEWAKVSLRLFPLDDQDQRKGLGVQSEQQLIQDVVPGRYQLVAEWYGASQEAKPFTLALLETGNVTFSFPAPRLRARLVDRDNSLRTDIKASWRLVREDGKAGRAIRENTSEFDASVPPGTYQLIVTIAGEKKTKSGIHLPLDTEIEMDVVVQTE